MDKNFYTYLDALRFASAAIVVFAHSRHLIGELVPYQTSLGLYAVAVFFVLSGYVIAFAACEKERTLSSFAMSRLARVYSVALAAIAISGAVQALSAIYNPDPQQTYQLVGWWKYLPLFLTFTYQVGPLRELVFGNFPFLVIGFRGLVSYSVCRCFFLHRKPSIAAPGHCVRHNGRSDFMALSDLDRGRAALLLAHSH